VLLAHLNVPRVHQGNPKEALVRVHVVYVLVVHTLLVLVLLLVLNARAEHIHLAKHLHVQVVLRVNMHIKEVHYVLNVSVVNMHLQVDHKRVHHVLKVNIKVVLVCPPAYSACKAHIHPQSALVNAAYVKLVLIKTQ
jgi:hypothetical protein